MSDDHRGPLPDILARVPRDAALAADWAWVTAKLADARREIERLTRERDEARSYILADEERQKLTGDAMLAEERAAKLEAVAASLRSSARCLEREAGSQRCAGSTARAKQVRAEALRAAADHISDALEDR